MFVVLFCCLLRAGPDMEKTHCFLSSSGKNGYLYIFKKSVSFSPTRDQCQLADSFTPAFPEFQQITYFPYCQTWTQRKCQSCHCCKKRHKFKHTKVPVKLISSYLSHTYTHKIVIPLLILSRCHNGSFLCCPKWN